MAIGQMSYQNSDTGLTEPNTGTGGCLDVRDRSIASGSDSTFNRTWGGRLAASKAALTASGAVGAAGARVYSGYVVTTVLGAGAVTLYDNTSAAGTVIDVIPAATVAGTKVDFAVPCSLGIYASFASTGTVLFLYN